MTVEANLTALAPGDVDYAVELVHGSLVHEVGAKILAKTAIEEQVAGYVQNLGYNGDAVSRVMQGLYDAGGIEVTGRKENSIKVNPALEQRTPAETPEAAFRPGLPQRSQPGTANNNWRAYARATGNR